MKKISQLVIEALIEKRLKLLKKGKHKAAIQIQNHLKTMGVSLEDTEYGTNWQVV